MDQAGAKVPAWKRLGLKLRNGDQSGAPAPDLDGLQGQQQSVEAPGGQRAGRDDIRHAVEPTENGKPSGLGKRKYQDGPAEGHGQAFKKSKKSEEQEQPNGKAGDVVLPTPKEEKGRSEPIPKGVPTPDKPGPKGDPNYRKKKEKKTRRISSPPREDATAEHLQDHAQSKATNHKQRTPKTSHPEVKRKAHSPSPGKTEVAKDEHTLLPSTETEFPASPLVATTEKAGKPTGHASQGITNNQLSSTPPRTDRRKSVTFTPDTKTTDGNSAANLFKKWVSEQKGANADFSPAEVAQFAVPPKVHPANSNPASQRSNAKEEKKLKRVEKDRKTQNEASLSVSRQSKDRAPAGQAGTTTAQSSKPASAVGESDRNAPKSTPKPSAGATSGGKKKDPSIYLSYLSTFHNDRENWKFNKVKQNAVIENALHVFRIPDEYLEALLEYIKSLKGASIIARLTESCNATLKELDEEENKEMADVEARKAAKEEALQGRITKEKKRRQLEADIENLADHPHPDGYIRRLKRRRAEALLNALNLAAPIQPATSSSIEPAVTRKPARKSKRRVDVSSDSSSDSSSSSESESEVSESSSSSEAESESESTSGDDGENSSEEDDSEEHSSSSANSGSSDNEQDGSEESSSSSDSD